MELNYQEIGKNIRCQRIKQGLKQRELAEKVNVSPQHISHIENGYTQVSLPVLIAISNELQIDCNTILGETLTGAQIELKRAELSTLFSSLDEEKLKLCVEICRLVATF